MKNEIEKVEAGEAEIAEAIRAQVLVVGEVELRGNFEKLKLGAMVSEAVRRLRLEGYAERGPTAKGGGAKGWWAEVCPKASNGEAVIPYKTVMMWRCAAENLPGAMGVGLKKRDEVIALLASNPEEAVGRDARVLKSAEVTANGMTMRQMLLWEDGEKRPAGRPVGTGHPTKISRDAVANAEAAWALQMRAIDTHRGSLCEMAHLLPRASAENHLALLSIVVEALKARLAMEK